MTTPANLTYSDFQTRCANLLRLDTTNTGQMTKLQALINECYREFCDIKDWWWLEKKAIINTSPNLIAGATNVAGVTAPATVSVSYGSANITFSGAITQSVAGYSFIIPGASNDSLAVYRVLTHTDGTNAAVLDAAFTNASAPATSYQLYQDSYSLPTDVAKVLQVRRYGFKNPLQAIGKEEMTYYKEVDTTTDKPHVYTVWDFATTGDPTTARQLVVHPYPDKAYRMEVTYRQNLNTELSGTTRPFIPDDYANILIYLVLARGYLFILNDQQRSTAAEQAYEKAMVRMTNQNTEPGHDNFGIVPRDIYRGGRRRTRAAGAMTLGDLFDRWPSQP